MKEKLQKAELNRAKQRVIDVLNETVDDMRAQGKSQAAIEVVNRAIADFSMKTNSNPESSTKNNKNSASNGSTLI
jgi:ribosomal protein S7